MDLSSTLFPAGSGDLFDESELVNLLGLNSSPELQDPDTQLSGACDKLPLEPGALVIAPPPPVLLPFATAVKPEFPWTQSGKAVVSMAPNSTVTSQGGDDVDTEDMEHTECAQSNKSNASSQQPKRRRRIRNEKQQELNRLAQQRYRKRKKEKQQALVATVDELAEQLAALKAKDVEISDLKKSKMLLEQTVAAQQTALQAASSQLVRHQQTIEDQQRQLEELSRTVADRQQQQKPWDSAALSERLREALKEALTELGASVDKQSVDKLTSALTRSLTSCGRDARTLLAALPKLAAEQPSPSMTVSCC